MERAAAIENADRDSYVGLIEAFDSEWSRWWFPYRGPERYRAVNAEENNAPRDADWKTTVVELHKAGLSGVDLQEAVEIAMSRRNVEVESRWRYFCGVCRTKLRTRAEVARALIASEED